MRRYSLAVMLAAVGMSAPLSAAVTLPAVFAEHMVVQQGLPIAIWGTANGPGDQVTVRLAGQMRTVTADRNGNFLARLAPMKSGGPYELSVADLAGEPFRLFDVLVGEVWLVANRPAAPGSTVDAFVSCPFLRLHGVATEDDWALALPRLPSPVSVAAKSFGSQLYEALKVPIGLIETTPDRMSELAPYSIRGVLWFLDDNDHSAIEEHLVTWRKAWGRDNLPVICVPPTRQPLPSAESGTVMVVDRELGSGNPSLAQRLAQAAGALVQK
jgi:sialate O-acetylesterase